MSQLDVIKDQMYVNQCFGCVREFLKGLSYKFQQTSWNLVCAVVENYAKQ